MRGFHFTPYEIHPEKLSEMSWRLLDIRTNTEIATATLTAAGWVGVLNSKLCGEMVNFLSVVRDTPEEALEVAMEFNVQAILDAHRVIADMLYGIEPRYDDPIEDVPVEFVEFCHDLLAAI